ncbi:carbon-nitrogen hydrolase family protein [Nesterenkonia sp. HG001]|uniref:carbon-nitrogen hydrolase family protein n=1 Tax=Nesterenkonia sp. HG001 TaxID=2983207 RepID=UPI002AC589F2|nr:carbon-nitrogen hydrolase family protein [Nesterenkonia sp. HG001]MDZ5077190.1 carbon-nitrogen hydrolase family protein [Nesterenkonia sp. HG001]
MSERNAVPPEHPAETLTVALAQVPPIDASLQGLDAPGDVVAAALTRTDRLAAEAADVGADLLLLPEMHLTGYAIGRKAVEALAEAPGGSALARMAEIARRHGVAICHGFPERDGDEVFNSAAFIDESGRELLRWRKLHLFGDVDAQQFDRAELGSAGPTSEVAARAVVDWHGWAIGLAICYDVEFPEIARRLALAGADLLVVPTANMVGFEVVSRLLVPARALENQMYVAYANYTGADAEFRYNGLSLIAGPDGAPVVSAGSGEELLIGRISASVLAESRRKNPYLRDRREDILG